MARHKHQFGPVSVEWKGLWKSSRQDFDVSQEAYVLASELLNELIQRMDSSSYIRGDFFGDRTLYLEVQGAHKVTTRMLNTLQEWLKSHPMWRVVIPVGKHEDAFIVYWNTLFRGTKEIHSLSAQHERGKRGRTRDRGPHPR